MSALIIFDIGIILIDLYLLRWVIAIMRGEL